jgi:purine-binding chemotaxis protein CheW
METSAVEEQVLQLVTFSLKGEEYAVDILSVQEINRITEITKVPKSPHYVEGVINLRGKVMPAINLRKKFGFEEKAIDETSRVIIIDKDGITSGLIVDSVSEVLRIPSNIVEPPPITSEMNCKYIKGIAKLENKLIILIDIDNLMEKTLHL